MGTSFLMISRVLYDKGYQEYVDAARIIKKQFPDTDFLLLGDIDESYPNHVPQSIVQKDVADGVINYLGYLSDVKPIIQKCDCIIHPTFYNEGLSRVLMEALAMSKVVITTDIPGCRETVEHLKNGFLVPPKNVKALVDAIIQFIQLPPNSRSIMQQYSRLKAERDFDIENVIKEYRRITG